MKTDVAFQTWNRKERLWLHVRGVVAHTSASGWEDPEFEEMWKRAIPRTDFIDKHDQKDGPPPFLVVVLKKHPFTNAMMRPRWYTPNPERVIVLAPETDDNQAP